MCKRGVGETISAVKVEIAGAESREMIKGEISSGDCTSADWKEYYTEQPEVNSLWLTFSQIQP